MVDMKILVAASAQHICDQIQGGLRWPGKSLFPPVDNPWHAPSRGEISTRCFDL